MSARRWIGIVTVAMVALMGVAAPAAAQEGARYALLVQGASGEEQYAVQHRAWLDSLAQVLRERMKFDAQHLTVLAEQPQASELKSTAENVRAALGKLAASMKASDLLVVVLIGHGAGDGANAKFNLVGPDLTIDDWNALLKPIAGRIAFVDTTSSSAAFMPGLAGPNRIVITATNNPSQRYHTVFPDAFIKALTAQAADSDKNGRISLLEAFVYASRLVAQEYEQSGHMVTEYAALDDTGDGKGRVASADGPDGTAAGVTYLDAAELPTSSDPEVQQLLVRQQQLTAQVDDLRRRKASMSAEEFDREFEKVIIELSLVSRDIRRRSK